MSAPTVDRESAAPAPDRLPLPLRILAALGAVMLGVRRKVRRGVRRIVGLLDRVGRSPAVAGPIAAISVAVVGVLVIALPVAGAWWGGVEPPGPWQDAVAVSGSVWVMSYGVPLRISGVDYSLIPLGLVVIPAWLAHQAGRWLVRVSGARRLRTLIAAWIISVGIGTVIVGAVSVLADIPAVQTSARRAVVGAAVIGAIAVGSGIWRSSDLLRSATSRIPSLATVVLRAAAVAVLALTGFAAILLAVAVASSFGDIANMFAALTPTFSDAVVLSVLAVAYIPTMMIWAMAYLLGAGVALGPDVLLSPFVAAIPPTPLPAFPPLAALPETAAPVVWALPALTVLAGCLAGLAVSRFAAKEGPLVRVVVALAAAVLGAAAVYLLMLAGSGSLGDGRLQSLGPDPALASLLAGVGLTVGALPASVVRAKRRPRRLAPVAVATEHGSGEHGSGEA